MELTCTFFLVMGRRLALGLLVAALLCSLCGCKPARPAIVPVSGTVTINSQPLGKAMVTFVPLAEGLDANFSATAVTDDQGKFTLRLPGKEESGCCACECKVLVEEGPAPDAAYQQTDEGLDVLMKHRRSLKNRPIPEIYQRISSTPLTKTITPETTEVSVELSR